MANAKGIDISHWQSLTDWTANGLTFVIAKASEGTTPDSMYSKHIAKARAANLLVGAYAFNRADVSINSQVDAFIAAAGDVDLYAIDVEEESVGGTQKFSLAQTQAFINRFRALTGKKIGLYMSESGYYFTAGQDFEWIAHWGVTAPTSSKWDIHQYRGSPLDLDQFNGTDAEMRAWALSLNNGGNKMNSFTVPEDRTLAKVKTGAWLYDNSDLNSSSGNVQIDPGRFLVYVGQFSASPDIRIVAYETAAGDTNTTSKAMFTARANIESFAAETDTTPFDQSDIDAAVKAATDPLNATIAEQATIIAGLKTSLAATQADLAAAQSALTQSQVALAAANATIADQKALIETLEAGVGDYEALRVALRKAVAP